MDFNPKYHAVFGCLSEQMHHRAVMDIFEGAAGDLQLDDWGDLCYKDSYLEYPDGRREFNCKGQKLALIRYKHSDQKRVWVLTGAGADFVLENLSPDRSSRYNAALLSKYADEQRAIHKANQK